MVVLVCAVDNCGTVKVFEETTPGKLDLLKTFVHSDSVHNTLEESWTQIRLSPSGNMVRLTLCHSYIKYSFFRFTACQIR